MNWNPSWANAIASIESQGSGGYSAVGPTTQKGNRAYGKYQVMDFNIPAWTEKHLGQKLTPEQFLQNPEAQDAVFKGEFGSYVSNYGNPQDAASAWFTGRPMSQGSKRSDILGTTGSGYVNKFNAALGTPNNTESKMIPEEKPRGLLGSLGIQKMEEGAEGEAGQRFFQRDTFKDTAANLAQGFAAMGSSPALQKMTADVASQRTESKAKNKTIEYLRANGRGDLADAVDSGSLGIRDAAGIMFAQPKTGKVANAIEEFEYAETRGELPEGVDSLPEYKKYIARAGRNVPDVTMHPTLDRPLSPMEISIDNEISKTFGDTVITGIGAANRNAATIKSVIDRLGNAEEGEALTGPLKGALGSFGRNVFAPTSQAILDDVGGVVQQSLREILGGQFAQKEGEQLIARAYNISSAPEVNAARLRALYMQLESISANKAALVDYVKANGTSAGFAGSTTNPSVDTFYNAMKQAESKMGVSDNQGPNTPEEQASIQQKRTAALQKWLKDNNRGAK